MLQYLDLLQYILDNGEERTDRTGTGTLGVWGHQMRFNLQEGFPLLTTKKLHTKSIVHELLWFLSGSTYEPDLSRHGVRIWSDWATPEQTARFGRQPGDLGPIYSRQWRNYGGQLDQIAQVIHGIRTDPYSRRHIVSAWNPLEANQVALPPCHTLFQFQVSPSGLLNCHLFQRSADVFLGVPFNIASYALLTHMIAKVTDLQAGWFVHSLSDTHLYRNHLDQARLQLTRQPLPLPTLVLNPNVKEIDDFRFDDIRFDNYQAHPSIAASVSV